MNSVLAGLQWTSCPVYIDDITVVDNFFDQHISNLQQILEQMKQAGLKVHPSKCQFLQCEVTFLVTSSLQMELSLTQQRPLKYIEQWPVSSTRVEVQQFLGLANYYRRFVKDFGSHAKPLHQLTEKRSNFK